MRLNAEGAGILPAGAIGKIRWYTQGGAGTPLTIGMPLFAVIFRMKKEWGVYFSDFLIYLQYRDGRFHFYNYFNADKTIQEVKRLFRRVDARPASFYRHERPFHAAGKKMEQAGLSLVSHPLDGDSAQEYLRFLEYSYIFWGHSLYPDLMDSNEEQVKRLIFGDWLGRLREEDIHTLMSPCLPSTAQREQADMLAIWRAAQEGISAQVRRLVQEHSRKYYFLQNDYEHVRYLGERHYMARLRELLRDRKKVRDMQQGLAKIGRMHEESKRLCARLPKDVRNRVRFVQWSAALRDERKRYNQIGNYVLVELAKMIARKAQVDPALALAAFPDEIPLLLRQGAGRFVPELRERLRHGIFVFAHIPGRKSPVFGKQAERYFAVCEKTLHREEIRGSVACRGMARGRVRIIMGQKDFRKMRQGDILVTYMTRPEFLPIMKKAAAFVTEEGGVTSHAAIVARELGIPCIIGTQVATKLLKDGDMIEVDADKGVVRIVKSVRGQT